MGIPNKNIPVAPAENKKLSKEEFQKKINYQRDRDAELVTGKFQNLENPRGTLEFNYKFYPGEPYRYYILTDGEVYRIPRGVARHLNNNCFYKEYYHLPGEFGEQGVRGAYSDGTQRASSKMQASRKIQRYAFRSMEFMDDDPMMNAVDIVEVTKTP